MISDFLKSLMWQKTCIKRQSGNFHRLDTPLMFSKRLNLLRECLPVGFFGHATASNACSTSLSLRMCSKATIRMSVSRSTSAMGGNALRLLRNNALTRRKRLVQQGVEQATAGVIAGTLPAFCA